LVKTDIKIFYTIINDRLKASINKENNNEKLIDLNALKMEKLGDLVTFKYNGEQIGFKLISAVFTGVKVRDTCSLFNEFQIRYADDKDNITLYKLFFEVTTIMCLMSEYNKDEIKKFNKLYAKFGPL
jgi:hypothetical protein